MGARSSEQWREHRALLEAIQRGEPVHAAPIPPPAAEPPPELEPARRSRRSLAAAIGLGALGALWVAAVATSFQPEAAPVAEIAASVSMASGPLALLGIVWLLVQRTSRREARRFGETAAAMRAEAATLDHSIAALSARIAQDRRELGDQAQQLLLIGEDTSARLSEVGGAMRRDAAALSRQTDELSKAAEDAQADMASLLARLPDAEERMRDVAALLRGAGEGTHEQAVALDAQIAALVRHGHEAEESAGGAAQRLAAQLGEIEALSGRASGRIDSAAAAMGESMDGVLGRAADAIEATRQGLDTQSAALLAMVEQGTAALERAGEEAAQSLGGRFDALAARAQDVADRMTAQDEAGRRLLASFDDALLEADRHFAQLDQSGMTRIARLSNGLKALQAETLHTTDNFAAGKQLADALVERATVLSAAVSGCAEALGTQLPDLLARVEAQAERGRAAIEASAPQAAAFEQSAAVAAESLARVDGALAAQREALDAIGSAAEERLAALAAQAEAVERVVAQAGEGARLLAETAGPQLVDALLRVRETAAQAAAHARDALAGVIPEAAAALGEASREALETAIGDRVEAQMAAVASASEHAVQAAHLASERLMRQMLTIAETTGTIEERITEAKAELANADRDGFSKRAALLIEQLNSIAIDMDRLLSGEIADSAWSAYLKGDRGVFTRRAVRLVEASEARAIGRRYDENATFRDQVNRYIHDFEAMLRLVLAGRDGSPLGVTLLSSDLGKLYVALAQGIERLRT